MQITRLCESGHVPLRQQSAHHWEQHWGQRGLLPVQLHRPVGPAEVGRADPLEQLLVPGLRLLPGPGPDQLEEGGEDVQGWRLSPAARRLWAGQPAGDRNSSDIIRLTLKPVIAILIAAPCSCYQQMGFEMSYQMCEISEYPDRHGEEHECGAAYLGIGQ